MKVLWLAPNFNHYKARFLNHLAADSDIDLSIWSGTGREKMRDQNIEQDWNFKLVKLNVSKKDFGNSKVVKEQLKTSFIDFDWVLIPAEKKNISLFLYAMKLRKRNSSVRLFSYNHAMLKSNNSFYAFLDFSITKFFNNNFDRIIFYTEDAYRQALENKLVTPKKAFWANNTVDETEIKKNYTFQLPLENHLTLLFIGRLIPSKRISDLINYFKILKKNIRNLKLEIIGDGPENIIVKNAIKDNSDITWHGTLVDETDIAPIMTRSSLVFIPGLSGLSINHAFAYGRPYITLKADKHGPEISYIKHGENGYILEGELEENISKLSDLLLDREKLNTFCNRAKETGEDLSVKMWVQQIKKSLLNEK